MDFDYQILEEKFKELPLDTQLAMTSAHIAEMIKEISDKNRLLIDQEGILYDLTSYVLLGLLPSKEFTATLVKEAGINESVAASIAEDINEKVFSEIRTSMRLQGEKRESESLQAKSISSLEHAGSFDVMKESDSEQTGLVGGKEDTSEVGPRDKNSILEGIENPIPATATRVPKMNTESFKEPLVDHLLKNSTADPVRPLSESQPTYNYGHSGQKNTETEIPANLPIETEAEDPKVRAMIDGVPEKTNDLQTNLVPMETPTPSSSINILAAQTANPAPAKPATPVTSPSSPNTVTHSGMKLPLQPGPKGPDLYREAIK